MTGSGEFLEVLREWAAERPDAVAVRTDDEAIGYGELVARIDRRAIEFVRAGLRTGDRVAVVADNSPDHLIAALGVWAARAVLVTIYPSTGAADLAHCLGSSAPAVVLAGERLVEALRSVVDVGVPVLDVTRPFPGRTRCAQRNAPHEHPDDLALICYTSGSTSRPKAVMHRHRGLNAAAAEFGRVWRVTRDDRTIVCLPMAWAFGLVTTSMTTLAAGGTVLPLPRADPAAILGATERLGATILAGVTTIYAKLVSHLDQAASRPDLAGLRLCITGGEPRNETIFAGWVGHGGRPVHDNFAASECFPVVTYDPVDDPVPRARSAGRVVPGARMRLIDPETGVDVGPSGPGEALWQGPALFAGYWGDPDATAAAITEDGWYRTKDLVRVDGEGYVYVEGRLSDMIIRGGSNVSPGEVEAVLRAHPGVLDAAVVGAPDAVFGQAVVAVVVPAGSAVDGEEIVAWCRTQLAGYKVPGLVVTVAELPLSPATGKIDRRQVLAGLHAAGGTA